ncbi:MAG TPA: polysialyltransferase family glycosyltransferase [Xanthomonadaceae bacterium]|jgi:hypothetical protein
MDRGHPAPAMSGQAQGQAGQDGAAIVWTPLQQVMLTSILREQDRTIDVLFLREGTRLLDHLAQRTRKVVVVPDLSYSVRAIARYRRTCNDLLAPELAGLRRYRCYAWTLENPFARFLFMRPDCAAIHLFEDGVGTYSDPGRFAWRFGPKHVLAKFLIGVGLRDTHRLRRTPIEKRAEFSLLYPEAFRGKGFRLKAIDRDCYRQTVLETDAAGAAVPGLPEGAILYLSSPIELSDTQNEDAHAHALGRLLETERDRDRPIFWKPHPRANLDSEMRWMRAVAARLKVAIEPLPGGLISEQIALANRDVGISIVSALSSSLYTLKALDIDRHRLVCIDSPLLRSHVHLMRDLYAFYRRIGIEVVA